MLEGLGYQVLIANGAREALGIFKDLSYTNRPQLLFSDVVMPGGYGAEGWVYQAYTDLPSFEGNRVVLGSWIVDGEAAGMLVRESDSMVTDYFSRVAPHVISDGLAPTQAQVAEWLAERVGPDAPTL